MVSSHRPMTGTNSPEPIEVVPLTFHIGVEIRGVDLTQPLSPAGTKIFRSGRSFSFEAMIPIMHSTWRSRGSSANRPSVMRCSRRRIAAIDLAGGFVP